MATSVIENLASGETIRRKSKLAKPPKKRQNNQNASTELYKIKTRRNLWRQVFNITFTIVPLTPSFFWQKHFRLSSCFVSNLVF